MIHSRLVTWTICGSFVAMNLVGFWLSHHRRHEEAEQRRRLVELQGRQGEALERWHLASPVAIESAASLSAIQRFAVSSRPVIDGADRLDRSQITKEQKRDLSRAIHGLAVAYRRGTSRSLIQYMGTRDEKLKEEAVARLRDYLVAQHGFTEAEVGGLDPSRQFEMFWDIVGVAPGWDSLIPEDSGITIYRCGRNVAEESLSATSQISHRDAALWQHVAKRFHHFGNDEDDLELHLASENGATFADVRLVVKHNGKGMHTICPYTVRFWYSEQRECWVPHLLAQFRTSRDIPRKLLF